mgnify:CR=1 FL=1
MTIYINLQGCLEMEKKEVSQSGIEAKPEIKAATCQQPYTKEFKDQLVEIYNRPLSQPHKSLILL